MAREFREKRASPRVAVEGEVSYKIPGEEKALTGWMKNLSGRGMMFLSEQQVPVESRLEVYVSPSEALSAPLHAEVKVVRVARQRRGDAFEIGAVIQQVFEA